LRDRVLVRLGDDLVFHRNALDDLKQKVRGMRAQTPQIDVARFKDATGVSRKYAIPLLEYLDRERVTRRMGDARQIL
jgi:selenocysteine-specific elongation factor